MRTHQLPLIVATFCIILTAGISAQNNSLDFDGLNDYINCGNSPSVQLTGNAITLEAWIYANSWSINVWEGNIINKELNGPNNGYMLRVGAGGKLNFNLGNGAWTEITSSTTVLSLNQWHHIAGVYDGTYLRLYVDGVATDSLMAPALNFSDATGKNLTIGSWSSIGRYFQGQIDEARIWNVARSKAELINNMNTEICNNEAGLVAYYKFNQGVAGGNNSSVNNLIDATSNKNNGTLSGFAKTGTSSNWITSTNSITPSPYTVADQPVVNSVDPVICIGSPDSVEITISGNLQDAQDWQLYSSGCGTGSTSVITGGSVKVKPSNSRKYFFRGEGNCVDPGPCASVLVEVVPIPTFTFTVVDELFGNDGEIDLTITSGKPPYKFDWNNDGVGDWDDTEDLTGLTGGNYTVIVEDSNGCADTGWVSVNPGTSIGITGIVEQHYSIYPNPAKDYLLIDLKQSKTSIKEIQMVNILGEVVKKLELSEAGKLNKFNLEGITSGVYFLKFNWSDKAITERLIIR